MKKEEVRSLIDTIGIVPCARVTDPNFARFAAETLYAAAIPILEIPLTLPEAPQVIGELARRFPDVAVGAGTVLTEDSARRSIDAGTRFITSPGFIPEMVACAKKADVVVFPGILTPTEAITARSFQTAFSRFAKPSRYTARSASSLAFFRAASAARFALNCLARSSARTRAAVRRFFTVRCSIAPWLAATVFSR